ncbi:MAG: MarR family transcriptional regulator, partial [Geminicoccaceae bacterium]
MVDDAIDAANLLERIGRLIRTEEQVGDLYPAQWSALRYLKRANRFSRTPMALAEYLGTTRGTISQTLIALERKGLITRQPSARDKRSVNIA